METGDCPAGLLLLKMGAGNPPVASFPAPLCSNCRASFQARGPRPRFLTSVRLCRKALSLSMGAPLWLHLLRLLTQLPQHKVKNTIFKKTFGYIFS